MMLLANCVIAGPLADRVFTPALQSGGVLVGILGGLLGKILSNWR